MVCLFLNKVDSLAKKIAQPAGHAISVVYSLFLESLHFHEVLAILVELLAIQYFLYYLFHCVILSFFGVSHSSPPVLGETFACLF